MRVGNFSVLIPEGSERESGHVGLDHGKQYTVKIQNHDWRQCDAEVQIDGKSIGTFRLSGHGQIALEHSPDDHGRFTFYKSDSADGQAAGAADIGRPDRGLVQVRFVPEKRRPRGRDWGIGILRGAGGQSMRGPEATYSASVGSRGISSSRDEEGITGLSGHSDQRFIEVGEIDRDEDESVLISLRLVVAHNGPRPLKARSAQANPVPGPVA